MSTDSNPGTVWKNMITTYSRCGEISEAQGKSLCFGMSKCSLKVKHVLPSAVHGQGNLLFRPHAQLPHPNAVTESMQTSLQIWPGLVINSTLIIIA